MHQSTDPSRAERYLKYGYYWPDSALSREPAWLQARYRVGADQAQYTPEEVRDLLRRILCKQLEELQPGAHCVIPLSGGLDSRLMLGEALHYLPAHQVRTVTFGNSGQLDYDLGRKTARAVGVENVAVELDSLPLTWEAITENARMTPWTYLPDSLFNAYARSIVADSNDIILSGFLGDPTTGGHLCDGTASDVVGDFFRQQLRGSTPYHQTRSHCPAAPTMDLLPTGAGDVETNALYLDLEIRQRYCVAPITTGLPNIEAWDCDIGQCQTTGARVKAPFAAPEWIAYWHGAPTTSKRGQSLYRSFISMAHPVLDRVGTKENLGARSRHSVLYFSMLFWLGSKFLVDKLQNRKTFFREKLNYVDYRWKFRHSDDYREILHKSAETLLDAELIVDSSYEHRVLMDPRYIDPETALVLIGCAANVAVHGR